MPKNMPKNNSPDIHEIRNNDLALAKAAMLDNNEARATVVALVEPLIHRQTHRFCRKYCYEQNYQYKCTLQPPIGGSPRDAMLCEWGNASFGWMLNDLTKENRLARYQGKNDASLMDYFFVIANSVPFFERWKDWRFDNFIYVPSYIQALEPNAKVIFRCLRRQLNQAQIQQETQLDAERVASLSKSIIKLLLQKGTMHLLTPSQKISYDEVSDPDTTQSRDNEFPSYKEAHDIGDILETQAVKQAFEQLNPIEQFVISGFYVEELSAKNILKALSYIRFEGSHFEDGKEEINDIQQLYYVRRKALKKLYSLFSTQLNYEYHRED